jgi:hypothetical protein
MLSLIIIPTSNGNVKGYGAEFSEKIVKRGGV